MAKHDHLKSRFTGWMLLNYNKPVQVSSTLGSLLLQTMPWMKILKPIGVQLRGNKGEWIQTDLGNISTVNAVQINYADQDAEFLGKAAGHLSSV